MTDKQICDRIRGALSASMMPMEMELECNRFLDRCLNDGWIPVEERLPAYGQEVIVYGGNYLKGCVTAMRFWRAEDVNWFGVTHWMPLPEPPGKELVGNAKKPDTCEWCELGHEVCGTCVRFFGGYVDGCVTGATDGKCTRYVPADHCMKCGRKLEETADE